MSTNSNLLQALPYLLKELKEKHPECGGTTDALLDEISKLKDPSTQQKDILKPKTKTTFADNIAPLLNDGESVCVDYNGQHRATWNTPLLECKTTKQTYTSASQWSRALHAHLESRGECTHKGAKETHQNFYVIRNGKQISLATLVAGA